MASNSSSSSSSSPSPSDSPPSPPLTSPSSSDSSPPPESSSAPPPQSSPPPSPPPSPPQSPPPAEQSPTPPAPPSNDLSSSPPPPPPPQQEESPESSPPPPPPAPNSQTSPISPVESGNFHSPPPPPRQSSNNRGVFSPPPPPRSLAPSKTPPNSPLSDGSSLNLAPLIIGVVAGAGLLLLVVVLLFFSCTRKKKKSQARMHIGPGTEKYYAASHQNWQNGNVGAQPSDHVVNMVPPLKGSGGWTASPPPPPPMMSSSDMSSANFSGPQGPVLPPPPPSVALGFNKSTFTYDELLVATGGFAQANLLGQGGFGYVHKGVLPNGKEIAVKSLKSGSGQGDREFQAEVEIISRVHHRHLVSLVGYCLAAGRKMLVYEFLPNNNLEVHLHDKGRPPIDWASRVKIAIGSAKGLAYLHEDCHPRIIHRDIKTANILLDFNFEAKVADFGLAKLNQENHTHVSTRVMGTFGYLAPEYASSGKLTEKSDVFSFGVVLLELITGRRPADTTGDYMEDSLVDWARPLCEKALEDGNYDELADPRLEKSYDPMEMARMVASAAASICHSARRRAKMSQIVRALEGDVSLEDLNEGVKLGQSSYFGSGSESYEASGSYSANMKKIRKIALDSQDYASSEYGATSEYGLDPSSSSDSSPEILSRKGSR